MATKDWRIRVYVSAAASAEEIAGRVAGPYLVAASNSPSVSADFDLAVWLRGAAGPVRFGREAAG